MDQGNVTTLRRPATQRQAKPARKEEQRPRRVPRYSVVLLDDNDHTYDYVIRMIGSLFGFDKVRAFRLAEEVDHRGRAALFTGTREHAELKQQQIHAFGADPLLPECKGSMAAVLRRID